VTPLPVPQKRLILITHHQPLSLICVVAYLNNMAPARFRVLAGTSYADLKDLPVNFDSPSGSGEFFYVKSDTFEGRIVCSIDGYVGEDGVKTTSKYFEREDRKGVTWSIQVQGRFLKPVSADDVMFGNTFDGPPKRPPGTSAALKFARFVDPTLSHDLTSQTPWALSPLISTMPYFKAISHPSASPLPPFDPFTEVDDDVTVLVENLNGNGGGAVDTASKRRKWFTNEANRRSVTFTPDTVLHMDFAYGYFQFPELSLNLPGGISLDLKKHWQHYPARFVCCGRGEGGDGPGELFFVVQFDVPVLDVDVKEPGEGRS